MSSIPNGVGGGGKNTEPSFTEPPFVDVMVRILHYFRRARGAPVKVSFTFDSMDAALAAKNALGADPSLCARSYSCCRDPLIKVMGVELEFWANVPATRVPVVVKYEEKPARLEKV